MNTKLLTAITAFLIFTQTFGQNIEFKASNFKDKKEEFKKAIANIEMGDDFLEIGNTAEFNIKDPKTAFKQALSFYEKAQTFNPNNAELNLKIGNCYFYSHEKPKAKKYFEKALKLDPEVDPILDFYLGMVYQLEADYDKALKYYKKFKVSKKGEEYHKFTNEYIYSCRESPEKIKNHQRAWVDNLQQLNSPKDDFGPCISADGESMIFTSRKKNSHQPNEFGEYDSEIYITELKKGKWLAPKNIGSPLNTEYDEGAGAFAYDGQRLLMYKKETDNFDIYESTLDGYNWTAPKLKMENLPFTDQQNETFACYEPLDIKVYYITDGGSQGGKNIFMSGLMRIANRRSAWGKGQSAGHKINTKFHDGSVYIHPDGRTMYFSSQGHRGMGGYDIYKATWVEGQWTTPENLGYPINTPYDELFFAGTASGKHAYIASNRPGGKGGLDLYKVTFWGPEKHVLVDSEDYLLASIAEPIKDVHIEEAVKVEKNSLTVFKGIVIDHITKKPLESSIDITDNSNGEIIKETKSNKATGKFLLSLPSGKNYGIAVKKNGYLFHSENFDIPDYSEFSLVNKDIELKNIAVGSKIALRNVFFDVGKADIKPDSYHELGRLVQLLNDVSSLKIELSGHTDNTGSEQLNLTLSQSRADAVMRHLAQKGVDKSRLSAKGYGSSSPIATNDSSGGRQENRRTEFEIIAN
ncbi:MAG: hypothetical protein COA57_12585 [Flavobacteriales bacterium]|nr:MAG: hypothetical protein COA57_12585 [Flavobacteriales bacterium]